MSYIGPIDCGGKGQCVGVSVTTGKKKTKHVPSDTFSWYFVAFALATPERPAGSFVFMFVHLLQPLCHGCEPLYGLILD